MTQKKLPELVSIQFLPSSEFLHEISFSVVKTFNQNSATRKWKFII